MHFIFAILMSMSAQAQTADQLNTVLKCQPVVLTPDMGLSVTVQQGGFAGLTQLTVRRFFLGHTKTEKFIVRESPASNVGGPIEYVGNGATLSVNFTTAPLKDGGHIGHLTLADQSTPEELSCKPL